MKKPPKRRRQPSSANSSSPPAPRLSAAHPPKATQQGGCDTQSSPTPNDHDSLPSAQVQDNKASTPDTTATISRSQKPSWNAVSRYYSETGSFPDYRPAQPAMGLDRLKRMNQTWSPTSANTLTTTGTKREFSTSSVSHQTVAKRQRLEPFSSNDRTPESPRTRQPPSSRPISSKSRSQAAAPTRPVREKGTALHSWIDLSDSGPPPSNVTSDITPKLRSPKRQPANANSPILPKHTAIRYKAPLEYDEIENSEDELQYNHSRVDSNPRQTNFSQIQPSSRKRLRMRGDITPTAFTGKALTRLKKQPPISILKAVSGKLMYSSLDNTQPQLYLRPSSDEVSLLEAWSSGERDEEYQWVSFKPNDAHKVSYGECYISFRRSMLRGRPPMIALQFASPEDAAQVAEMINGHTEQNCTREEMKRILDNSWESAVSSSRHVSREGSRRQSNASEWMECTVNTSKEPKSLPADVTAHPERPKKRNHSISPVPEASVRAVSPVRRLGMETRRSKKSSPPPAEISHDFQRWSEKNTNWKSHWKQTLVYPATGRNRASVDKEDISRLDEGEFLNDNLISFYLRYLQTTMERERPDLFSRVHIFSTFFFEKLMSGKGGINYDGVKNWTSKLDLFSYDYIVVPVNEKAHWYMSVICNTSKLLDNAVHIDAATDTAEPPRPEAPIMATVERDMSDISLEDVTALRRSSRQLSSVPVSSPAKPAPAASSPAPVARNPRAPSRRVDISEPRIVTLDSLGAPHAATCRALKEYLIEEAKDKKNVDLVAPPGGMKARHIPEQTNYCDCGVFLLSYMEMFLKDPDDSMRKILMKENVGWSIDAAGLRRKIRNILFELQKEQADYLAQQRKTKRKLNRKGGSVKDASDDVNEAPSRNVDTSKAGEPSTPCRSQTLMADPSSATCRDSVTPPPARTGLPPKFALEDSHADDGVVDIVQMPLLDAQSRN